MSSKLTSVMIGGLASALIGTLFSATGQMANPPGEQNPVGIILGILGCLTMFTSGIIAVWHYTGEHSLTLTGGQGVKLGALAGIAYGVIITLLSRILMAINVTPDQNDILQQLEESGTLDTPGAEIALGMTEFFMGWGGVAFAIVLGAITGLIGGAIGAAIFKRGSENEDLA